MPIIRITHFKGIRCPSPTYGVDRPGHKWLQLDSTAFYSQAMSGVSLTGGAFSMPPPLMAICSCIGTLGCEKRRFFFLGCVVTPLQTKMSSKKRRDFKCKVVFEPLVFRGHVLVFGRVSKHFPYKMGIPKNSFGGSKVGCSICNPRN